MAALAIAAVVATLSTAGLVRADDLPTVVKVQLGHVNRFALVNAVAFSPDGRLVASASNDHTIKLWDVASGRELRTFTFRWRVWSVAFSPDGHRIAAGSEDEIVRVWSLAGGPEPLLLKGHSGGVNSVTFSPDGHTLASGSSDGTIRLWDAASGGELRSIPGPGGEVASVAFSSDSRRIAAGGGANRIGLWDVASGRPLRSLVGHADFISSVAFSPDGRRIVSGGNDRTVRVWDAETGLEQRKLVELDVEVRSVSYSPRGDAIAAESQDGVVRLWDAATGRATKVLDGHLDAQRGFGKAVAFSPDGRTIAASARNTVEEWDVASGRKLRVLTGYEKPVSSIAVSGDGRLIAAGSSDQSIRLWDAANGRALGILPGHEASKLAFSPDGRVLAAGGNGGAVELLDVATGRDLRTLGGRQQTNLSSLAFSPDGRTIASGSSDGITSLWDTSSGRELQRFAAGKVGNVVSVAILKNSGVLVAGDNAVVETWNPASGNEVRKFAWDSTSRLDADAFVIIKVLAYAPSPDEQIIVSGDQDGRIRSWSLTSGSELDSFTESVGQAGLGVFSLDFSPDGRSLASGDGSGTIKLWDVVTRRELHTLIGHEILVDSVVFSPDRRTLVSGGLDGTVRRWSLDGQLLATSAATSDGEWVTVTPEGFFDSSEHGGVMLNVVHGLDVSSVDQVYDALHRPDLVREKLAGDPRGLVRDAAAKLDLGKAIASGRPPSVTVSPPVGKAAGGEVTVEGTATDAGGGIGRVEWRVNGVTLGIENRGLAPAAQAASAEAGRPRTVALRQTLPVQPGPNTIDVRVYNAANLVASEPLSVTVDVEAQARRPRLFVLAAGIDRYDDDALRLSYSVADARAVSAALRDAGGGLYRSVEVTTLLDKEVTASGLDAAFTALGARIVPEDVFVFYVAGHGITVDGRYYFLPRDFRYDGQASIARSGIGQDRWQDWLRRIPAQKSILLYDTCDSGALTTEQIASRGLEEKTALDLLTRATGRTTLTATTGDEPALEGYGGHGVFTYALLDGLDKADLNGDGLIDLDEMITFVNRAVPEISERAFHRGQFPQVARIGGNFPLAGRVVALAQGDDPSASLPRAPTHVVILPAAVHQDAGEASTVTERLTPGTQVRLVETANGWTLVARDGQRLGYLKADVVAPLH